MKIFGLSSIMLSMLFWVIGGWIIFYQGVSLFKKNLHLNANLAYLGYISNILLGILNLLTALVIKAMFDISNPGG